MRQQVRELDPDLAVFQARTLSAIGIAAGVIASLWLARFVDALLFGVSAVDLPTLAVMVLAVAALSALACYLPARRATQIQPITVLKAE